MNNFNQFRRQIKQSTFGVEISELIFISVNMKRFQPWLTMNVSVSDISKRPAKRVEHVSVNLHSQPKPCLLKHLSWVSTYYSRLHFLSGQAIKSQPLLLLPPPVRRTFFIEQKVFFNKRLFFLKHMFQMKPTTTSEKTITVTPRKGTVLINFVLS